MTCRYYEINQHDALYLVARQYPGGVEALAGRMGKSSAILYNKLRPGISTHHITFEEASEIIELCQQAGVDTAALPLEAMAWRLGRITMEVPRGEPVSNDRLTQLVCKAVKEFGDVHSSIYQALDDDNITPGELANFENEFKEAIAALFQLRERVREYSSRGGAK